MSNNIFYKALAAVSTVGIIVIAGIQVTTALKKGNNAEDQLAKTMVEIKNARKDALSEVKAIRSDLVKELNNIRSNTLNEIKADRSNALNEVKSAKKEALKELERTGSVSNSSKVWLVLRLGNSGREMGSSQMPIALEKIPMKNMEQCQLQGSLLKSTEEMNAKGVRIGFECVESE